MPAEPGGAWTRETGPLSGTPRSGLSATAEPTTDVAGHVPAAAAGARQATPSAVRSALSVEGRITVASRWSAWPPGCVTFTVTGGWLPCFVWPGAPTEALMAGAKGSAWQPEGL